MTLDQAQNAIRNGGLFGDVFDQLVVRDRIALAKWFCRTKGLPNLKARVVKPLSMPTGDACTRCGGLMVRTGSCLTCQLCGESSGGCG